MFTNRITAGGTNCLNPKVLQPPVKSPIQKTLEKDALNRAKGQCQPSSKFHFSHYLVILPLLSYKKKEKEKEIYNVKQSNEAILNFKKRNGDGRL